MWVVQGTESLRLHYFYASASFTLPYPTMPSLDELQALATQVRRDIVRMVHGAKSGHPGGSLGCADLLVALYFEHLRISSGFDMDGKEEDIFFLSNGHISPVWYSVLARRGYFPLEELATFRHLDSRLQGHPATKEKLPGVRVASGSLGQGLSVAIGAALAKKLSGDKHLVYVLMGDGEQQEGQVWEAALFAHHHKVDNLIALIDCNNRQIDGDVDKVMQLGSLEAKYKSFGWHTMHMRGNDMTDVLRVLKEAVQQTGAQKPIVVLVQTEMGYGVDYMMGSHKWHGVAPNDAQLEAALAQLPLTLQDY
jgi:transketolase